MHWLVKPTPHETSPRQEGFLRGMDWPGGRVQTCIAGQTGVITALRGFLAEEKNISRAGASISSNWKIGLIEVEHQKAKRAAA